MRSREVEDLDFNEPQSHRDRRGKKERENFFESLWLLQMELSAFFIDTEAKFRFSTIQNPKWDKTAALTKIYNKRLEHSCIIVLKS